MRCVQFKEAREIFGRCGDLDERGASDDVLVELESCFLRWYNRYAVGRIGRITPRADGSGGWIFLRLFNRFMDEYKEVVRRRIWRLLDGVKFDFMLTLTMKPMGSLPVEFDYVSKRCSRVRAWLFKWFKSFSFVKVLEITGKGRPHIHVLLSGSGCSRIETEDLFDESGKRLFYGLRTVWGHFVKVRQVWRGFSASAYVLKYVYKSLKCGFDGLGLRYASLLFASNKRVFSMSQDLSKGKVSAVLPALNGNSNLNLVCGERPPITLPDVPKRRFHGCCDAVFFDSMCEVLGWSKAERFYSTDLDESELSRRFPLVMGGECE